MVDGANTETVETEASGTREAEARLFARIISGTDATVLERAVNAALATIPLAARPQVQLIAPLGRPRAPLRPDYLCRNGGRRDGREADNRSPRRLSVNYETLK